MQICRAYALQFPRTGYCQGMNFVALMFLRVFEDEEAALWCLASAANVIAPDYFDRSLSGARVREEHAPRSRCCVCSCIAARPPPLAMVLRPLQVDIRLVEQLMPLTLPKIAAHLDAYGVPLQLGAASWIMTLFADCFPASTSLRFWDWMVIKVHSCGLCASWHLGFSRLGMVLCYLHRGATPLPFWCSGCLHCLKLRYCKHETRCR